MHDPHSRTVLLFETDSSSLEAAFESLDSLGYQVATTHSAIDAVRLSVARDFDLFLLPCPVEAFALDSLVREIRTRRPHAAIVLMTEPGRIQDALALLERGADDYVLRPPRPLELRLRLERLLDRDEAPAHPAPPSREAVDSAIES